MSTHPDIPFTRAADLDEGERAWMVALDRDGSPSMLATWSGFTMVVERGWADDEAKRRAATGEWDRVTVIEGERRGEKFRVLSRTPYVTLPEEGR